MIRSSNIITIMKKLFVLISVLYAVNSFAMDAKLDNSRYCERYFSYYEQVHDIPSGLLKAISLTETKIWHKLSESYITWPWAVNAGGKAYYFDNKMEAIKAVESMMSKGQKSFDVSCMQVNLLYHPKAFTSLEQAFEPKHNINYAASFLKSNYEKHKNWHKAIAAYHSENPVHGTPYAARVMKHWGDKGQKSGIVYASHTLPQTKTTINRSHKRLKSNMLIEIKSRAPAVNNNSTMVEAIAHNALNNF